MRDKTLLKIITLMGLGGCVFLFRKGSIKDWSLVYLFKALLSTLIDGPVAKKKLVTYPTRFFKKSFDTNIIFDYVIFPSACVIYSQLTNKTKAFKTMMIVFILSVPMTIIESLLDRYTGLVKFSRKWSWFHTFAYLTVTFWSSRIFIAVIRLFEQKRITAGELANNLPGSDSTSDIENTQKLVSKIKY